MRILDAPKGAGKTYALALLVFNALGVLFVYAVQRLQFWLPLNPQALANVSPDSAFNTAVSFASNTNWQGYGGETTMSYLTQMLGLAVQNFLSAATGIVVVIALIRGFSRHSAQSIASGGLEPEAGGANHSSRPNTRSWPGAEPKRADSSASTSAGRAGRFQSISWRATICATCEYSSHTRQPACSRHSTRRTP